MDDVSTLMVSVIKTEQIKEECIDWEDWQLYIEQQGNHNDSHRRLDFNCNINIPAIKKEILAEELLQENESKKGSLRIVLEGDRNTQKISTDNDIKYAEESKSSTSVHYEHQEYQSSEISLHPTIVYPFSCHICEKPYFRRGFLEKHFKEHIQNLWCSRCEKNFDSQVLLLKHLLIQSRSKRYKCNKLEVSSEASSLIKQSLTNSNDICPKFKCNNCKKTFIHRQVFDRHTLTHSAQKLYQCEKCKKEFSYSDVFKRHLLIHTDIYPYECVECGKKFRQQSTLNKHSRVHSGLKPYKCKICEKSFSQSSSLTRHCVRHTGEKAFKCADCGRGFTRKGHVRDHILLVHNLTQE